MSVHSLEIERQQILERMHARRDDYRRALLSGGDIDEVATGRHAVLESHVAGSRRPLPVQRISYSTPHDSSMPGNPVMRAIKQHPVLCALGVAAVFALGPKRIARSVMTSGASLTALTTRNLSNVDMLGRLLTLAGTYVQDRQR